MRILWLNANLLLPLDKGGKLRTWHLMRQLARQHEITYVAFADAVDRERYAKGMGEVCAELVTVPHTTVAKGTWRFRLEAAASLLDPLPYAVGRYRSAPYRSAVDALLARTPYDLVVCDFLVPAVNLTWNAIDGRRPRTYAPPAGAPTPMGGSGADDGAPRRVRPATVLFTHNVEAEIWRRHAETQPDAVRRFLFRTQWHRMRRFEGDTLRRFDLVLAVSDTDRDTLRREYGEDLLARTHVVATGVDTSYFQPAPVGEVAPHHLVFTGSMDWIPNEDAMVYCCEQILPRIRAQVPDATLSIIGRAPTPAVRRLGDAEGIEVTGAVDDVRPHVATGAVYVVPLRIGGGTRLKIFEAMAMGKAVVSTTVGAEGLPLTDGVDVVLADDPQAFAERTVALLRDAEMRARLGASARRLVVDRYDWSAVSGDLEQALGAIVEKQKAELGSQHQEEGRTSKVESKDEGPMAGGKAILPSTF